MIPPKAPRPSPHDKSSFLDRMHSRSPLRGVPKEVKKEEDKSLFHGHQRIHEGGWEGVEQSLKRDPHTREEIKNILKIGNPYKVPTSAEIDAEIQKLEDRLDLNNDDAFTKKEVELALLKEDMKRKAAAGKANPFNPHDQHEIERRKEEDQFLKEKFGKK